MKAVILADKYSKETIKDIVNHYRKYGINEIIICVSTEKEVIEENEKNGLKIIYAGVGREYSTARELEKIKGLLGSEPFFITFGDYICDLDLSNFICFHKRNSLVLSASVIKKDEKNYISGGFLIADSDIFEYITDKSKGIEIDVLSRIGEDGEIAFYVYKGSYKSIYARKKVYEIIKPKI